MIYKDQSKMTSYTPMLGIPGISFKNVAIQWKQEGNIFREALRKGSIKKEV